MVNYINTSLIEGTGVFISIFLVIYLIRQRWEVFQALLLACLILILTNRLDIMANLNLLIESISSFTAFYLVSMVVAITLLGHLHREIGAMEELISNLRLLIRDSRALIIFLPAAISLFSSVPGGAVISAPMVEKTGKIIKMPALEQAVSNMVYRHLVVLATPFNASLVMASALSGISIAEYLIYTIPVITIVFAISAIIIYKRYPLSEQKNNSNSSGQSTSVALLRVSVLSSPYLLAITLGLAGGLFFPLAMLAGILVCLFIKLPARAISKSLIERIIILGRGFNWKLALSTLTIVIYKDYMLQAESFQQMVHYLLDIGLPLFVLLIVLPFITGFISGNNAASLGISMPILLPLLGTDMLTVRYLGILYLSSYTGYLGSPVHLCTYVTNEYFKTPLYSLIKEVNIYGLLLLAVGIVIAFIY